MASSLDDKDVRSSERSRQRRFKASDIRRNDRCVRCKMCRPEKWWGNRGRASVVHNKEAFEVTKQSGKAHREFSYIMRSWLEQSWYCDCPLCKPDLGHDPGYGWKEIPLEDLVVQSKVPRGSVMDFEMVARPQVLVLEESESDDGYDDEWEEVELPRANRRSYAHAVKGSQ